MAGREKLTTYLRELGYNVVRLPQEGIKPLDLVGKRGNDAALLGSLDQLITNPPGPLPEADLDRPASDINGKTSSKLKLAIGANILGNIIAAFGGNLGLNTSYTNAKRMQFVFNDVFLDSVNPLSVGNYLRNADIDVGNPLLNEFVMGKGELYVITSTAKTKKLTVSYEKENGTAAEVEVPVISGLIGGTVGVDAQGEGSSVVSYQGPKNVVFGFKCLRVGILDGNVITLKTAEAGKTFLAVEDDDVETELLSESCLLDLSARA